MSLLGLNYIDGLHFTELIKKSLTDDNVSVNNEIISNNDNIAEYIQVDKDDDDDDENICLITQEPLTCYQIELDCGHKFNYDSIFNEFLQQQKTDKYKFRKQCPYCRRNVSGVLPYCDGYKKMDKINHPPSQVMIKYRNKKCDYILTCGKNKGNCCKRYAIFPKNLCKMHQKIYDKKTSKIISKDKVKSKKKNEIKPKWETSNEWKQCKAVIKSGKNAGQRCKCSINISNALDESKWYCGRHKNYIKI